MNPLDAYMVVATSSIQYQELLTSRPFRLYLLKDTIKAAPRAENPSASYSSAPPARWKLQNEITAVNSQLRQDTLGLIVKGTLET